MSITGAPFETYQLVFDYLGRVYLHQPDSRFVAGLAAEDLFTHWPLAAADGSGKEGLALLRRVTDQWQSTQISRLEEDYTRLFIGLEQTLAPPYESVYLSRDHIMFEKQTLAVRRFYERFGLQALKIGIEPDDHIGLELSFLAHLCRLASAASETNTAPSAEEIRGALGTFLRDHLLLWYTQFTQRVIRHARTDYYRGHAHLTRSCIESIAGETLPEG